MAQPKMGGRRSLSAVNVYCCTLFTIHSININILNVKGRSDLVFYIGIFKKLMAIAVFYFTIDYGVIAVLYGQIAVSILSYIPNSYFLSSLIDYTVSEQVYDFLPNLCLSAVVFGFVYYIQLSVAWDGIVELGLIGIFAVVLFLSLSLTFKLRGYGLARELILTRLKKLPDA